MSAIQIWKLVGCVVIVGGLPQVFSVPKQRKQRDSEEQEGYRLLFGNHPELLKTGLGVEAPGLRVMLKNPKAVLKFPGAGTEITC
ncbi:MAG: hypothetical protein WBM09_03095 [Gallionella sp.]